jgi:hypothetical protein
VDVVATIHDIHALISEKLKLADVYQATSYYNRRTKPFEFAENNLVWLSTANLLPCSQPCAKFRQRFIDPYAISLKISSHAYRLRLPESMHCHCFFHIFKLKQYHSPHCMPHNVPGRIDVPHDEFIMDAILEFSIAYSPDRSHRGPRLELLTHWVGYDTTHDSWEPYANLKHV